MQGLMVMRIGVDSPYVISYALVVQLCPSFGGEDGQH